MFSVSSDQSIDILPTVEEPRPVRNNYVQTEPLLNESTDCQYPQRNNFQMQTDVPEIKRELVVDFDPEALSLFLKKVTPMVLSALDKNHQSHAFDRYNLLTDIDSTTTQKLYSLEYKPQVPEVYCSDISWNSTGTSIAVSYSSISHEDWCEHDSAIGIWNLFRKDFNPQKPSTIIETDCCISAISFHPTRPALLAGGSFNGVVMLWNIGNEDDMLVSISGSSFDTPREPISGLFWHFDTTYKSSKKFKLLSCSIDGKILFWKSLVGGKDLEPLDGFVVLADQLPRSLNIKSTREGAEVGVTSLSFNCEDPSIFTIGAEGGGIFQCSLNSQILASNKYGDEIEFKCPVVMAFQKQESYVNSVHFSPFSRKLFLSAGSSGEIHIFNLLQSKPILKLQLPTGILQAQWSPVRPLVIFAVCEDGKLYVWDLAISKSAPTQSLPLNPEKHIGSVICFDRKNSKMLATGCGNGDVQVWQLGTSLTEAGSIEMELLLKIEISE